MNRTLISIRRAAFWLCVPCCLAWLCCCTGDNRPILKQAVVKPFAVPATKEMAGRKAEVQRVDVNNDGFEDAVVMYYRDTTKSANKAASKLIRGFEVLVIHEYNPSTQSFAQTFQHPYFYGTSVEARDVNRDGVLELVVATDGGGNSALATRGMAVIGRMDGTYKEIAVLDEGAPELITTKDSVTLMLSHAVFAPDFSSKADEVQVIDSVHIFSSDAAVRRKVRDTTLRSYLVQAADRYRQAKSTLALKPKDGKAVSDVYSSAVAQLLYLLKLGLINEAQKLRQNEQSYWAQTLPAHYRQTLQDIVSGVYAN
jgi:hypothetical protein